MLQPGLVSISFRALSRAQIIALTVRAGLRGIEWGGDLHVPHGDIGQARDVGRRTRDAGLEVAAYGSYYRVGHSENAAAYDERLSFERVLESALEVGAPSVRVWAGKGGSAQTSEEQWRAIIDDALRIADLCGAAGLKIAYEYHAQTLTDTPAAARRLLQTTNHPAIGTLWQPSLDVSSDKNLAALNDMLPRLVNLHVYHWTLQKEGNERRPLSEGADNWTRYFQAARATGRDHWALLEFVRGDEEEALIEDARTLIQLTKHETKDA